MSRTKTTVLVLVAFAAGYAAHLVVSQFQSTAAHWRVVNDYRAYMRDPTNQELDSSGRSYVESPSDHEPSLAALVAAGELEHVDLVLPLVPNSDEVNRYWMEFVNDRDDIVEAYGNPEYVAYKPAGQQPLHLRLWFRKNAADDVQQLIKDLDALARDR
jgi:hypothetical protein